MLSFYTSPAVAAEAHRRARVPSVQRKADGRPLKIRMADAMLDIAATGQVVDKAAMQLRGFLGKELTEANIDAARDVANERAIRKVG
jgi:hypothetical protein